MDKWKWIASGIALLSGIQGYTAVLPVDSVTSSGIGALIAVAVFGLNLILKKKPV